MGAPECAVEGVEVTVWRCRDLLFAGDPLGVGPALLVLADRCGSRDFLAGRARLQRWCSMMDLAEVSDGITLTEMYSSHCGTGTPSSQR